MTASHQSIQSYLQEAREHLLQAIESYVRAGMRSGFRRVPETEIGRNLDDAVRDLSRVIRANEPPQAELYRVRAEVSVVIEAAGAEDAVAITRGRLLAAGFDVHSGITAEPVR